MLSFLDLPTALAITPAPVNTTVLRGATVALTCKTDANPAAHLYHFYFDGNHIGNSSSGEFNVTVEKDGVYTCVPINTVGTGINATVRMTVLGKFDCRQIAVHCRITCMMLFKILLFD